MSVQYELEIKAKPNAILISLVMSLSYKFESLQNCIYLYIASIMEKNGQIHEFFFTTSFDQTIQI